MKKLIFVLTHEWILFELIDFNFWKFDPLPHENSTEKKHTIETL
jgi:hypothetical protein